MSLEATEKECAAVATAPRVALADIENAIAARYDTTADKMFGAVPFPGVGNPQILSVCMLIMRNGFMVLGKSAPASPENFNAELGRKLAYEDCIRQLWPLMGFALRDKLQTYQEATEQQRKHAALHGQDKAFVGDVTAHRREMTEQEEGQAAYDAYKGIGVSD